MRALICNTYGSPADLAIEEREIPRPGEGQVGVELKAAGLNFPDLLSIAGKYQVRTEPPFIPGIEAAGVVTDVGEGVSRYAAGDRVIVTTQGGAFAEHCVVDANRVIPLPDPLSFEVGAGFAITYLTSYHAFRQCAPIEPGQSVLVLGAAGGVGTTAVEISKAMGAFVIAAASSEEKLEFARQFGADEVVNYSDRSLKDSVRSITDGKGVDVVYDPVGGQLGMQALSSLGWRGRHLVVGFASGEIPAFPANLLLLKEARLLGVYWGDWAARNPGEAETNIKELGDMIGRGEIRPRVSATFPLDRYEEAFSTLAERRALGKVVMTF